MTGFDERFLTRNGLAARQLAVLLLNHEPETRLPRVRDFAVELGVGNGTVQAALQLLENAEAIETTARGHLGTFLVRSDRSILWRLSGLGTLLAAMPLPYSRRYEGLATGLRAAFEEAGAPFAITFMRGAGARTTALLEGKVDLVVLSRFAADRLIEDHPVELVADLGPATYVGAHGLLLRRGSDPETPGLRVAVDHASEDQRMLAERAFAGRSDIEWIEASYMQLRELFEHNLADATVWNLDEVQGLLGMSVDVLPLGDEVTRDLSLRNSSAAIIGRTEGAKALGAVRESLDLSVVTTLQAEVLRGERTPSY
ncbi:GntR family transcriptional regulator [Streptomyces scopuliridis]|uniref:GntR family transcriptional regulator n=2 Tax=Streptomyces scopuliridis TaxID=452529 RepID=A0A2T7TC75_9ACTN|nr:GntR family transcriptional regulator YhfZ [Streptomyces scopuliridis]PVE12691.1 GntR family transcriptional regulator [Streptomyces scopuliridis RB72]WSB33157.1 GntR family transcriptional regulator [Streptomyces scopuliridis]WSB97415.1 GntR family transcriptional regulator [Streptomyces scopuliridis]WSC08882.1 GntR family transcriptional regulator [Streptomyces scopuliridis]